MMRLNAIWGLEPMGPSSDIQKAMVKPEEVELGGVFANAFEGVTQLPMSKNYKTLSDLDKVIQIFTLEPEDTFYFIYLIPNYETGDPYDLVPLVDIRKPKSKET
jgi:hypothetical protein